MMTRTLVHLLVVLLLASTVAASTPGGESTTDPEDDQDMNGPLWNLEGTALKCRDPAFDVVHARVDLLEDTLEVRVTVADATALPSCALVPQPPLNRHGVVHMYFDGWTYSGYYLAWHHEADGRTRCAGLHTPDGYLGCVGGDGTLDGNTLTWSLPREGTVTDPDGVEHAYALKGPFDYKGATYSRVGHGTIRDTYGW